MKRFLDREFANHPLLLSLYSGFIQTVKNFRNHKYLWGILWTPSAFYEILADEPGTLSPTRFHPIQIIVSYYLNDYFSLILFHLPFSRSRLLRPSDLYGLTFSWPLVPLVIPAWPPSISIVSLMTGGVVLLEILFQIGGLGVMMISTFFSSSLEGESPETAAVDHDGYEPTSVKRDRALDSHYLHDYSGLQGSSASSSPCIQVQGYYDSWRDAILRLSIKQSPRWPTQDLMPAGDSIMPLAHDYFFLFWLFLILSAASAFLSWWISENGSNIANSVTTKKPSEADLPFRFSLFAYVAVLAFVILFVGNRDYLVVGKIPFRNLTDLAFGWIAPFTPWPRGTLVYKFTTWTFSVTTLILFSLLMFIGCSPSSWWGHSNDHLEIIIGLYLYSFLKGEAKINDLSSATSRMTTSENPW